MPDTMRMDVYFDEFFEYLQSQRIEASKDQRYHMSTVARFAMWRDDQARVKADEARCAAKNGRQ